jgi:outer membrane protein assembly factor BamB
MTRIFRPNLVLLVIVSIAIVSCTKEDNHPSDSKEVSSFGLKKADGSAFASGEVTVAIHDHDITISVPPFTNLNPLIPFIDIKGKSISPASGQPQDFRQPVVYTVTADDNSKVDYRVSVHVNTGPSIVYFGSSNKVFYAVNAQTGALIWNYTGGNSFAYSSPTYANGTVYVGGIDNNVYAFDAISGTIKWQKTIATTGIESDVVFADGTVYVGTNDDYLYALDATTGQTKWTFLTGSNISSSPTIANGVVYFGSSDGKLYALQTSNGQLKWSFQTGAMINQSGACLVNGVLFVGSRDGYLYSIDANTGTLIWKFSTNGVSLEQSSPTVANGVVYIGAWYDLSFTTKGSLYAVNATTGQLIWEKLQNTGISSSPCVASGKLYITCDDLKIHALDAMTGANIWEKQILPNSSSPVVSGDTGQTVYVGGGGTGYFYAFDALTGAEKWKFSTPSGSMTSSPLVLLSSGVPYHPGDSGEVQ